MRSKLHFIVCLLSAIAAYYVTCQAAMKSAKFVKVKQGFRVIEPSPMLQTFSRTSLMGCSSLCANDANCNGFQFANQEGSGTGSKGSCQLMNFRDDLDALDSLAVTDSSSSIYRSESEAEPQTPTAITTMATAPSRMVSIFCTVSEGQMTIDPYPGIEAERANYFFDARPVYVDSTVHMAVVVNSVESSLGYFGVDFGQVGATSVNVHVATAYQDGQRAMVNLHLDSPTTKPFATVEILNTGSLTTFVFYYADVSVVPTGIHDVYVTFVTDDELDTICYFDSFEVYP